MTPSYAVVTVTHHPDPDVLRQQLRTVASAVVVALVDNASGEPAVTALRELARAHPNRVLICHERNLGLAAALNAGAGAALQKHECEYVLFLDQDTEPGEGGVERLLEAASALRMADPRAGLFGPEIVDAATGLSHGVHVVKGWRWTRVFPRAGESPPLRCAAINGSGMVVPADVLRALRGFDESFFIDHVDSEWSFRVAAAGYHLYTLPGVRFSHRMGARSIRFWLGRWRVWPYRTPARHYYLFRNAVVLMKRTYVPRVWKLAAPIKLALTALVHAVADPARASQLRAMLAGVRTGLRQPGARGTP